jgi:hypothetical protein
VFWFTAGGTQSQQPVYTTEPPHLSRQVFATKHSLMVHAPALPPPLPAAPAAPPAFALPPLVLVPPALVPAAFVPPEVTPPAPPLVAPPTLAPPTPLAPAPLAPAPLVLEPLAPAFALPPSLEELEQPTHQVRHAKPIKTLLLAENRSVGLMPGAYHALEFPQQRGSGHHAALRTATLLFLGVAARR